MSQTILVQINFLGPYIDKRDLSKLMDPSVVTPMLAVDRENLQYFFDLPFSALSQEVIERYIEVTSGEAHNPIVPHSEKILEKLLKPLKYAKISYCLGNYVGSIASCGLVSEMLLVLLWKINEPKIDGKNITGKHEKYLWRYEFEKLGQKNRENILKAFNYISEDQFQQLNSIRNSRRKYLHLWEFNQDKEKEDALNTFLNTAKLFKEIIGIGLADAGTVKINPLLKKFLEKTGNN